MCFHEVILFVNYSVITTIRVSNKNKNKRDEFYFVFKSRIQGLAKTMKCFKLTPNFNEPVETNSLTILMILQ